MRGYIAFTKKEFLELIRSYKAFILLMLFLFLGFMNPITAKLTPELIKSFAPAGMSITTIEPVILDSWIQFFKNVPQFGIIVVMIMFSHILTQEISKGTLINMLTKGLKRSSIILSKLTLISIVWTIGYWLSFLVTYCYNFVFWNESNISNLILSAICVWLFGIFLITLLILFNVLLKSNYGGLLGVGGIFVVMMFMNMFQPLVKYNPIQLISVNIPLISEQLVFSDISVAFFLTIILSIVFIIISIILFNKKRI